MGFARQTAWTRVRQEKVCVRQGFVAGLAEASQHWLQQQKTKGAAMTGMIASARNVLAEGISRIVRVLAVLAGCLPLAVPATPQTAKLRVFEQFHVQQQHFSCTLEYPSGSCLRDLRLLARLLEPLNALSLGAWQWVVVARSEWKPFCTGLGVDELSPAMTSFLDHQTFLDEALFEAFPGRGSELAQRFGVPPKELLILALTHELGHAVCRDATETGAERFAEEIRRRRPGRCDTAATPVWGYRLPPGR
jgi:hypothetical protein